MEIEFNVSCLKAAKIKSDIEKELGMEQLTLWDKQGKTGMMGAMNLLRITTSTSLQGCV